MWGHGYVLRYFIILQSGIWLKRYRCPDCGAVHTCRPIQYFRGFWHSWRIILHSLISKIRTNRWLREGASRQAQQYWWKGFRLQTGRKNNGPYTPKALLTLLGAHTFPATHSLDYFEIKRVQTMTYPIFAVTPPCGCG